MDVQQPATGAAEQAANGAAVTVAFEDALARVFVESMIEHDPPFAILPERPDGKTSAR
jgi:hypothetical protein